MTRVDAGISIRMGDGVVHLICATYGLVQEPDRPDWRLACDPPGRFRGYDTARGRETGSPLTCLVCIDATCVEDD